MMRWLRWLIRRPQEHRLSEPVGDPAMAPPAATDRGVLEQLAADARKALALANQEAHSFNHEYIGTHHMLLALLQVDSIAAGVLRELGLEHHSLRIEVAHLAAGGPDTVVTFDRLPSALHAKRALEYAVEEARQQQSQQISTEHLLLGLLRDPEFISVKLLCRFDLKPEQVRDRVLQAIKPPG